MDDGVSVIAEASARAFDRDLRERMTPLRITVTNESEGPIELHRGAFQLVDGQGYGHRAMVPSSVSESERRELQQAELPLGVLPPTGVAEGYLYFERLPNVAGEVTLLAEMARPDGLEVAKLSIDFVAEER